jgi:hypothetical protein
MKPQLTSMKFSLISLMTLAYSLSIRAHGQSQIVTPDDQTVSFQSANGTNNLVIGQSNGYNTFMGTRAGQVNSVGSQNVFLGALAGQANTSGTANTFLGYRAGASNTTGQFNSFIGVQAGQANISGNSNYFFGTNSGASNTTGSGNYFLGDNAGGGNSSGGFNVYIGANAGNGSGVNGDNNLAIGFEAGKANQSGVNNTFIGFRADAGASTLSNATAIGNNAKVNISNAVVLGEGANVGIGTSSPAAKLHVVSGAANTAGLRFGNLTNASPASLTNQTKFLTVDGSGNVILASSNSSTRAIAELWQVSGEHLQNSNSGGVVIGHGVSSTPVGYKLFVEEGILTEKVKVAVKSTDEWSDKVFDKDYALKSLSEVDKYIKVNQHLPGVPSAKQMVEQGNDLHQTDAKLLEKIEELTLYMIDLKKNNDTLNRKVNVLEKENLSIKQKWALLSKRK